MARRRSNDGLFHVVEFVLGIPVGAIIYLLVSTATASFARWVETPRCTSYITVPSNGSLTIKDSVFEMK